MIDLLERVALRFEREESPQQKLSKLEGFLVQYGLPLAEAVPLFAALLSLPLTADYAPLTVSPEQQKQKTLHALLTILLRIAAQQPVLFVMEDLHWVDPSTLELLSLLVDQGPTARILALLTFRPDFSPPWTGRSHLTQVTLPRLPRRQAAEMTGRVAHGKALPPEVVEQVVAKTDGVPLFVEELTKMVLESGLLQEREERYELTGPLPPLAIPATLHDSLMARLDRLATVKGLAQLGATLGREFSYELLQAVSPWDEATLQRGLHQLVEAEFLYQRGLPPQATYLFKHALIQDAAYQSLAAEHPPAVPSAHCPGVGGALSRDRARPSPSCWPITTRRRASLAQAIPYWQRAGQRAIERSANLEAIGHLTKGLEVLATLPDTPERTQQELDLQITLGPALMATKGYAAPEVEQVYARARELCQQVGETPQLFPVLWGLWWFYEVRAELQTARELGEQLLSLAQRQQDPALLLEAHRALGQTLFWLGELAPARAHLEQGIALYDPQQHRSLAFHYGQDPGVGCRIYRAPGPCGCWAIRTRPCSGGRRRSPWPRSWRIPSAWRLPWIMRPGSISTAGRGRLPRSRPRPSWRSSTRAGVCRSGWRRGRSCGAGRWPRRDRERRGSPRCARAWPPCGPRGQSWHGRCFWPCWPRPMGRAGRPRRGCACWPRRWRQCTQPGSASGRQSCIGSRGSCCWTALGRAAH